MREHESALLASHQKELGELKAELERERQRNAAATAAIVKKEQPPETGIESPDQASGAAALPSASAPSTTASIAAPGRASAPASSGRLRGVPNVLTPSTLLLQGRRIRLFGVEAAGDDGSTGELTRYLGGREVVCEVVARPDIYRCQVDGRDLSLVVLFNGGGRVTADGTAELKSAMDRARSAGIGIWNRSASRK
jgi:endonuclease YncB( thermonuclease family)